MKYLRFLTVALFLIIVVSIATTALVSGRGDRNTFLRVGFLQAENGLNYTITAMPTYNFTLGGHVYTGSNLAVSNGTIRIVAFNNASFATTDTSGFFNTTIGVPPDTPDGLYLVSVEFQSGGTYAPSSSYAWVNVVREPLNFTIGRPNIIISGSQGTISGKVASNGTALSGCVVSVNLPWSVYYGKTDQSGKYQIPISVPLLQFSPSVQAVVTANPAQPYIETSKISVTIGLFNPIGLIVPGIIAGVALYEIRNLELFSKKEAMTSIDLLRQGMESVRKLRRSYEQKEDPSVPLGSGSKILRIYNGAIDIAAEKFHIRPADNLTIREMMNWVSRLDENGRGSELFCQIAQTMEDFAYAAHFDESRIESANSLLSRLKSVWRAKQVDDVES